MHSIANLLQWKIENMSVTFYWKLNDPPPHLNGTFGHPPSSFPKSYISCPLFITPPIHLISHAEIHYTKKWSITRNKLVILCIIYLFYIHLLSVPRLFITIYSNFSFLINHTYYILTRSPVLLQEVGRSSGYLHERFYKFTLNLQS